MKSKKLTLKKIIDYDERSDGSLKAQLVSKEHVLDRAIDGGELNRPGLSLAGFYDAFAHNRIQLIGKGEYAYLQKLESEGNTKSLEKMVSYEIPCFIFSHRNSPSRLFLGLAATNKIPVLVSELNTNELIQMVKHAFGKIMAPRMIMHGVMMEIFGMGVMITGGYGVGKSECALELIERGHIFVADDVVDLRLLDNNIVMASSSKVISHHMEIQGVGIINVAHLFGVRSIRNEKSIDFIIAIEQRKKNKHYERIGLRNEHQNILGVRVPSVLIPIHPGTNIPMLIEAATMNQRLKMSGYNTAKEFSQKIMNLIEEGKDIL